MEKVRVVVYGVGAVGGMLAKALLEREGVQIIGAVDVAKDKVGRDLGEVIGCGKRLGIQISRDVDTLLSKIEPDVAVHATSSYLEDTYPQIASIVKHGVDVVSTCEELTFPYTTEPILSKRLDDLAKKHDATVLGTGINPGFLMDTLVIALTAPCQKVEKIEVTRIMNAATRRLPFQKKIGAGLHADEFRRRIAGKEITGHVGLEQSIAMIADALAWRLDKIEVEPIEPIIAQEESNSKDIKIKTGQAAGLRQRAKGIVKGNEVIVLDFRAYVGAKDEYDAVTIKGIPPINQKIAPCVHGDIGTVAMVVNAIPRVMNAPAGLHTMKDLPIPSAIMGNMRRHLSRRNNERRTDETKNRS